MKGAGKVACQLEKGVHECVSPALCNDLVLVSWVTQGAPARRASVHGGELVNTVKACGWAAGCGCAVHDEMVDTKVGTGGRRFGQAVLRAVSHDLGGCQGLERGIACGQVYTVWAFDDQRSANRVKMCDEANDELVSRLAIVRRCRRARKPSLPKL